MSFVAELAQGHIAELAIRSSIDSMRRRIGIDFDNTIINYHGIFLSAAKQKGLLDSGFQGGKDAIRAAIRRQADGEEQWQRLQGEVYGPCIMGAELFEGVESFLKKCRAEGHDVFIVSHKTEYGHFDAARINLRAAALHWMEARGFFRVGDGFGMPPDAVFFESTRAEKIARIAQLHCSHFVDDLPEVLDDPAFPKDVVKILFTNGEIVHGWQSNAFGHWSAIAEAVLS